MILRKHPLRLIGYVWSAPTTIAALIAFLIPMWGLGQLRPLRWHDGVWEWTIVPRSWMWNRYTKPGWAATTLGWCVFFSPGLEHDPSVAIHERRHVWQALWLGPLYFPLYVVLFVLYGGYRRNPMEVDAYDWEERLMRTRRR